MEVLALFVFIIFFKVILIKMSSNLLQSGSYCNGFSVFGLLLGKYLLHYDSYYSKKAATVHFFTILISQNAKT